MKKIGAAIAAIVALALGSIAIYSQTISSESVPADDEITLHIQLDTEEDVGLLIYDYCANGHEYSGGISNADRSLLKRNEELIVVWNQQALNNPSDTVDLSIQFRIITEYVDPNYENIYPEEITRYLDSVSWDASLGESYFLTITGDQTNGYILNPLANPTLGRQSQFPEPFQASGFIDRI